MEKITSQYHVKLNEAIQHFAQKNNICLDDLILNGEIRTIKDPINVLTETDFFYSSKKIFSITNKFDENNYIIEVIPVDNYLI